MMVASYLAATERTSDIKEDLHVACLTNSANSLLAQRPQIVQFNCIHGLNDLR